MNFMCFIFVIFLFVVLTPSNFVRLPKKGNKFVVSLVHGIIFAVILFFIYHYVMSLRSNIEGLKSSTKASTIVANTLYPDCNVLCNEKLGYTNKKCIKKNFYNCLRSIVKVQ